jgi:isoleucyl-tRNA synthetase
VDEALSNWYVRRNRDRFWGSQESQDKLAAFQTLYAVLTTLTKLLAPIIPFVTETLHQNLVASQAKGSPASVHLCDYPEPDDALIDADLSGDMDALLHLASLGLAARNTVKIKVRQPLAELKVQPADVQERRAVERFADQFCEELNVKRVTLHDPKQGALLDFDVKPNMKTLGPKFGPRLKEVLELIAKSNPTELAQKVQAGEFIELNTPNGPISLEPGDLVVTNKSQPGWTAVTDGGTVVALNVTLTESLKREGMAREVVRHVQSLRKDANLELEDRITLFLNTSDAELSAAIQEQRDYIMAETLTTTLSPGPIPGSAVSDVKADSRPLHIELQKA